MKALSNAQWLALLTWTFPYKCKGIYTTNWIYNPQIEIVSPAETKQYFNIFISKTKWSKDGARTYNINPPIMFVKLHK